MASLIRNKKSDPAGFNKKGTLLLIVDSMYFRFDWTQRFETMAYSW
jgi:hypothetical protein